MELVTIGIYSPSLASLRAFRTITLLREVLTPRRSAPFVGAFPKVENEWKNHFHEMKGDVGMSHHEKEREQEDAYTKTESHSYPSLHLCFFLNLNQFAFAYQYVMCFFCTILCI